MNITDFLSRNKDYLSGKSVAVTGATGGLGEWLSLYCAALGASLILLCRNPDKAVALKNLILKNYPHTDIHILPLDLEDMQSVKSVCKELEKIDVDILIHNAGAYSIPRHICSTGYDNVFQINCASPYYMTKHILPHLREKGGGRVVIVGSIAHNYSKTDTTDIDFSSKKRASLVYGNAKRRLMLSCYKLFEAEKDVKLSIVHPGITFTNITAHYPKLIFALIKHPMKIIFMKPKTAAMCLIQGVFEECGYREWIGPRFFDIWGSPKKKKLHTFSDDEAKTVFEQSEQM